MLYGYQTLRLVDCGSEIVERFGGDGIYESTDARGGLLTVSLARQLGAELEFKIEKAVQTLPNGAIVCPWEGYLLPDELREQLTFPTDDAEVRLLAGDFAWKGSSLNDATKQHFTIVPYERNYSCCNDAMFMIRYRSVQLRDRLSKFVQQHPRIYAYDTGQGDGVGVYYLGFSHNAIKESPFTTHLQNDRPDNKFVVRNESKTCCQTVSEVYRTLRDAKNQQLDNLYWQTHVKENRARMFLEQNAEEFEKLNKRLRQVKEAGFFDGDTKLVYIDNRYEHSPYIKWGEEAFWLTRRYWGRPRTMFNLWNPTRSTRNRSEP